MELKQCPNCKKNLPVEARFCPYCMTKLIQEKGTVHIAKSDRKRKRLFAVMLTIIVLVIVAVATLLTLKFIIFKDNAAKINNTANGTKINSTQTNKEKNNTTKADETNTANSSATKDNPEEYSNYLGTWYGIYVMNIEKQGGEKIEICKVQGDTITFCIGKMAKNYSKVATVDFIQAKLINNQASFSYDDDGYGNAGQGVITLKDNKIHATVKVNNPESATNWDMVMDTDFYLKNKIDEKKQRDIKGMTGKVFEEIKGKFGQLTKKEVGASFTEYQFEKSVYVRTVNDPTNNQPTVINIKVFYDWLPDNLNVGYRGISSKTKKSEVEQKLSDYWIVDKSDYTQTFQNQETYDNVKVYYDNNGYVEQIDYS